MADAPLRILMISAEVESFARTGGLGDVVEALSRTLATLGHEVVIVTPLYGVSRVATEASWWAQPITAPVGWGEKDALTMGVLETRIGHPSVRVCLLASDELFRRRGIYGDTHGPFGDNEMRFAALSRGALSVAEALWGSPDAGGGPHVIHAHDWHAAPAILYAKLTMGGAWAATATTFTIHNLAFQGVMDFTLLDRLGIPREPYEAGWLEHEGGVNVMKGAIELADTVTTVSPSYAREIQQPAFGHGLDTHLRKHKAKLAGILNGIDTTSFDPAHDPAIEALYDVATADAGKRECKRALLAEAGLDEDVDAPLFGLVSRLTWQKGIDLLPEVIPHLVARGARFFFVGQGDAPLESALLEAAAADPTRVATRIAFDGALARRMFSGCDALLVPSRYEPCGLTQLYGMRYGAIPVVTAVGGLGDTVTPFDALRDKGTGFVAEAPALAPLLLACNDAVSAYADRPSWARLVQRAMQRDSAWTASARAYVRVYEAARARVS